MGLAWQAKHAAGYAAYKHDPLAERYKAEAEQALEAVVRDYGDCLYLGLNKGQPAKSTLGKLARSELFELRSLQPGKLAPDVEGEDLDGVALTTARDDAGDEEPVFYGIRRWTTTGHIWPRQESRSSTTPVRFWTSMHCGRRTARCSACRARARARR
jgi:hypothetical protein